MAQNCRALSGVAGSARSRRGWSTHSSPRNGNALRSRAPSMSRLAIFAARGSSPRRRRRLPALSPNLENCPDASFHDVQTSARFVVLACSSLLQAAVADHTNSLDPDASGSTALDRSDICGTRGGWRRRQRSFRLPDQPGSVLRRRQILRQTLSENQNVGYALAVPCVFYDPEPIHRDAGGRRRSGGRR